MMKLVLLRFAFALALILILPGCLQVSEYVTNTPLSCDSEPYKFKVVREFNECFEEESIGEICADFEVAITGMDEKWDCSFLYTDVRGKQHSLAVGDGSVAADGDHDFKSVVSAYQHCLRTERTPVITGKVEGTRKIRVDAVGCASATSCL